MIDKTTLGGYSLAVGIALGSGIATIPADVLGNSRYYVGAVAVTLATFGSALLGHSAADSRKAVLVEDLAVLPQDRPIIPSDIVDPTPPPEKKTDANVLHADPRDTSTNLGQAFRK